MVLRTILLFVSLVFFKSAVFADVMSIDQNRVHYYFLRASLVGQSPFAKSLSDFKKRYDQIKKDGDGFPSIYQQAQQSIEYNPKGSATSSAAIFDDIKVLSQAAVPSAGKVFTKLTVWTTASKYLLSGSMKSPTAFETLAMNSAQDLEEMRNNIIFFVTQQNAGNLSEKEQKALDLLFRYYTGVPASLSTEQIMDDPLMLPVKESAKVEAALKEQMSKDLKNLGDANKQTKDLLTQLTIEIQTQEIKNQLSDATTQINQASSFTEVDNVIKSLGSIICQGAEATACEESKMKAIELGDTRKDLIASKEFEAGVDAGIELGLAISSITKNEDLGKTFKALEAVNKAYHAVSNGMATYSAASTTMGAFAGLAGAATGVIGAVAVLSSLTMDSGGSADEAILEALQELKEMIIDLSKQIEAGFQSLEVRSERIETLLVSYSNLTSKNQSVLQQEIVGLSQDIKKGLQPLKFIELSYAQKQYEQFTKLASQSYKISFALPSDPKKSMSVDTKNDFRGLLGDFFSIIAAVQSGEYKIQLSTADAIDAHFDVINEMAAYPSSRFRTAFLVQNAINAANNLACGDVNLIGYIMTSEAAMQMNQLIDKMSHAQLNDFFQDKDNFNIEDFKLTLNEAHKYLSRQRRSLNSCVTKGFFDTFEKDQLSKTVALLDSQVDQFFGDGQRLNDMLITLQSRMNPPGGFQKDKFFVGHLIKQTYSFDPVVWEKQDSQMPTMQSMHEMGTATVPLNRLDLETILPSYELRLAHLLGVDSQFYFRSWWQINGMYAFVIEIALANPKNQKVVHIWRGYIKRKFIKDEQIIYAPKTQWGTYHRLATDILPQLEEQLRDNGGWRSGMFFHLTDSSPQTVEWEKKTCKQINGLYSCNEYVNYPSIGSDFDPNVFFQQPLNVLGPDNVPISRNHFYFDSQVNNVEWLKEFTQGTIDHVNRVREITVGYLSPCLEGLVQGSALDCSIEGQENLFLDRHRELFEIQNYNLIRMTLDANSKDTQRILDLTDLSRVNKIEVPESPDAAIRRIETFRNQLMERIQQLEKSNTDDALELPSEVEDLMDNDFYWLNDRLKPFLAG